MAYTIEEFVHLDLSRLDGDGQVLSEVLSVKCKTDLRENSCSDYFDELSKLVEAHPVGIPALRR
jgi:hypothetical protein